MDNSFMPYRNVVAYGDVITVIRMDDRPVLNIGITSYAYPGCIGAYYNARPD
jgi:hypothetical protein